MNFASAWQLQNRLADEMAQGKRGASLMLLEHPHTYTFGRQANPNHLLWDAATLAQREITVEKIDRGGDITYHGPGQIVGYPILRLSGPSLKTNYVGYLRQLEKMLVIALARLGVVAAQREGLTGVWVPAGAWAKCSRCDPRLKPQPAKIASIGIKVDVNGITRHGFSLNIDTDPQYWQGIVPCGLPGVNIINLSDLLNELPANHQIEDVLIQSFAEMFNFQIQEGT
jgi:lipoate-protein ligase B